MAAVRVIESLVFLVRCELLRRRMLRELFDLEVEFLRTVRA